MELVGYRVTSFKPDDAKEPIEGFNLYLVGPENNVTGKACERVFLTKAKIGNYVPKVGDKVGVVYNRYGKVDHLEVG